MSIDYEAQDLALDDELRAIYANEEQPKDPPSDEGTESTEQITEQKEPDEGTLVAEVKSEPEPENKPDVVDAERYKASVKAMNLAQQDLADRRKKDNEVSDYIKQLQEQNQSLLQSLENAKAADSTPTQPIAEDDTDLKEAKEIYPEVINPLLKIIANLEKKLAAVSDDVGNVKGNLGNVKAVADRYQISEQKSEADKHFDAIRDKYPDLDEIIVDPTYADWYHNQGPLIQQALQKGSTKDAISALKLYRAEHPKESVPEVKQETKPEVVKPDKLAAAREAAGPTVKSSQKPIEQKQTFTQAQIAKMSREEFSKNEAAIDEAVARGEIY